MKNAPHQLEATTLMHLFLVYGLLEQHDDRLRCPWRQPDIGYGARFCNVYANYLVIHREPLFSFEWAWNLLQALSRDEELTATCCRRCDSDYIHDRYALDFHVCPACEIRTERRRRPGARQFVDS
ncbi:MAG: hypothetical protein AAF270_05010 [Pseudomonadota bacterium]